MSLLDDTITAIGPLDAESMAAARARQDQLTKPLGALGRLESLSIHLAGMTGLLTPPLERKTVLIMAADRTEVTGNEIRDNRSAGIALISLKELFPDRQQFDVGTETEGSWIHENLVDGNGTDPAPALTEAGLPGVDLLWGASGWDNAWSERQGTRFPRVLPGANWPDFLRVAYWRALTLARILSRP
jgi:hypothetical protein